VIRLKDILKIKIKIKNTFLNAFKSFFESYSIDEWRPVSGVGWERKREKTLTLGQTLQSGQSLPSISLLNTDVDVILLRTNVFAASKRVSLICKGVCRRSSVFDVDKGGKKDGIVSHRRN
jgi:hypothetical protein